MIKDWPDSDFEIVVIKTPNSRLALGFLDTRRHAGPYIIISLCSEQKRTITVI
jgi:hypothetical protein